ncbi:MAG: hypothetical protein ACRDPG_14230 [Nocardioidaceae bacterium]
MALTWSDVLSAVRRVGVPALDVHAPRLTLVNLKTTFYTEPVTIDRRLTIIGYDVDVQVEPVAYVWTWGDGSQTTTTSPGRPFPARDVTHTYVHAADDQHPVELSVDVSYRARYRVDNGAWQRIPQRLTVAGPLTRMPVKQASAVLVSHN